MDQYLQYALDFARGKLTFDEFELLFGQYPQIWDRVQELLTEELIQNPGHPFWSRSNRMRLESSNFSVMGAALAFGWDEYGKRVAHGLISDLAEYTFPGFRRRNPPEQSLDTLLEKLGLEALGGAEVDGLVEQILLEGMDITPAKERNKLLKQRLKDAFHLNPRKKPDWAQEPAWPMGKSSPMEYLSAQRQGERMCYLFRDADSGEEKTVEQLY